MIILCSVDGQTSTYFYIQVINIQDGTPESVKSTLQSDIRPNEDNIPLKLFEASEGRYLIYSITNYTFISPTEEFGGLNVRVTEFTLDELSSPPFSSVIGGQAVDDNLKGVEQLSGGRFLVYGSQSTNVNS